MIKDRFRWLGVLLMSLALVLTGCSSDDGGGTTTVGAVGTGDGTKTGEVNDDGIDTGIAATATTVAGKVTLSSVLTQKARAKAAREEAARYGKPGSFAYNKAVAQAMQKARVLPGFAADAEAFSGNVYLYNATHPEWVYPVAEASTTDGTYTLSTLTNAAKNGGAYEEGAKIPGGNYTILAVNYKGLFPNLVALQSVVSEFAGDISGVELEAQKSTASPTITTMLGVSKNTDGTQTWGDSDLELAPNAAVQVSFSLPMFREAVTDTYLDISSTDGGDVPAGIWTLSADWLTATYYPNEGETWTPGKTYEVKVTGADGPDGVTGAIYNIFGRFLEETGTGTFKVVELAAGKTLDDLIDIQPPTAQIASPTLAQTANPIEITTPLRIASNERMDVNGMRLTAEPSLGAQPGVLFVGKNKDGLFEYEFSLGEPLKLATTYTATVKGGKDLAGNLMIPLTVSFTTEASSAGIAAIDDTLTGEALETAVKTVNNQADVKDVFGKWVRGFNDRNLPQLQSLMSGEFEMEYDTTDGFRKDDVNRDGALNLDEFSAMINSSFLVWDHCEITMTGTIVGDINVDLTTKEADFAFTLSSDAGVTSPECKQAAVEQDLFANLLKVNGAWYIKRASEGVDNRDKEQTAVTLLNLVSPADGASEAISDTDSVKFEWTEVADASAYVWIVFDERKPSSGFALILPPTMTSLNVPNDIDSLMRAGTVAEVAEAFGFTDGFEPRDGSKLMWQVAALGGNTVEDVKNNRATDLPSDMIAMSELWGFKIPGTYQTLSWTVAPNNSDIVFFRESKDTATSYEARLDGADEATVKFNEFIGGYDVGSNSFATITVTTPDTTKTEGFIEINGNTRIEKKFAFENGVGSVTVVLNKGSNQIMIADGVPCWFDGGNCDGQDSDINGIREWFNITTTGGIKPVILLDAAVDADENGVFESSGIATVNANDEVTYLEANDWNWYESTDAVMLKLSGKVNFNVGALNGQKPSAVNIYVGNQNGARAKRQAQVDSATGVFSTDVEVFNGDNWIDIQTSICTVELAEDQHCEDWQRREFRVNMGVYTNAGSEYTPPFQSIVVADDEAGTTVITQKENWGDGGRWNASAVTDNQVHITGVLEFPSDASDSTNVPRYNINSDGGWQEGTLPVNLDGSFELTVDLYNGDNWVNLQDVGGNNYHLSIFTDKGNEVVRPEITMLNGAAPVFDDRGNFVTTECSITIEGTAQAGEVVANWGGEMEVMENGATMRQWFGEEARTEAAMASDAVEGDKPTFTVTLPLVGSSDTTVFSNNWINLNDKNWNGFGFGVRSTGDCTYTPPVIGVSAVKDSASNVLPKFNSYGDNHGQFGNSDYTPVTTDSITIEGTSSVSGRKIFVEVESCGATVKYDTVAGDVADIDGMYSWSISNVLVYNENNRIRAHMGSKWDMNQSFEIEVNASSNSPTPDPVLQIFSMTNSDGTVTATETTDSYSYMSCGQSRWDMGAADSLKVVVTSSGLDSGGEWRTESGKGFFDIVDGTVTLDLGQLYTGENRFELNDYNGNRTEFWVDTTGGTERPKIVALTTDGTTALADPLEPGVHDVKVVVTGDPKGDGSLTFKPQDFEMWVWVDGMQQRFVNQPHMLWGEFGEQLVTLNPVLDEANMPTGDFTFTMTLDVAASSMDSTKGVPVSLNGWINGELLDSTGANVDWLHYNFNENFNDDGNGGSSDCFDCSAGGDAFVDCSIYPNDPSCTGGSGGPELGAMPPDSTNVVFTMPVMNDTVDPTAVAVSGTIAPALSGTEVARLMVFDPASTTGDPLMFMTTDANDSLFGGTVPAEAMLSVDGSGGFNTTLNLSGLGLTKYHIAVMVWADSTVTNGDPGAPMYGYMVEVMAP